MDESDELRKERLKKISKTSYDKYINNLSVIERLRKNGIRYVSKRTGSSIGSIHLHDKRKCIIKDLEKKGINNDSTYEELMEKILFEK